jgi:hypothetical protein
MGMGSSQAGVVHLKIHAFGLAIGVTWALGVFLLGILGWLFNFGTELQSAISSVYRGYAPTFPGSVLGALWALVDGFIVGLIIAWLYNKFSHGCCKKMCSSANNEPR